MSDVRNVNRGIVASIVAGVFFLMFMVLFIVMSVPLLFIIILLPLALCMFIPGFIFLYRGFPLKYRGLLLFISFILSIIPSIIIMTIYNNDFFNMFQTYIMVFLALIFIVPAVFHIYLEFLKEDVPKVKKRLLYLTYYVSVGGLAFLTSLSLFGFGFAPQDYIISKFGGIIGGSFIMSLMFTGVMGCYFFLSRSNMANFLMQIIIGILSTTMGALSILLIFYIILLP